MIATFALPLDPAGGEAFPQPDPLKGAPERFLVTQRSAPRDP